MTRDDIVAIARGYLGVRFSHQGRVRKEGLDCLGFLLAVAYDRRDYGARPDTEFLQGKLGTLLQAIPTQELGVADILLLRIDGRPQHLAMVSDYPEADEYGIIHAYAPARKVVEHRLDTAWKQAIFGVYRLPILLEGEGKFGADEPIAVTGV
jgi:hypothetical protein